MSHSDDGRGGDRVNDLYRDTDSKAHAEGANKHYELPARFFEILTGGRWNVYSMNLWEGMSRDDVDSFEAQTLSQERKLDLLAEMLELKEGQRVFEIGCGWGGPLTYLTQKYGIRGTGITISEKQREFAEARARREGVDVTFKVVDWREFQTELPFDAIFSDGVITHFFRLEAFFRHCYGMLKDGGVMVHKELHLAHRGIGDRPFTPTEQNNSDLYGGTANYRPLGEELTMLGNAGFMLDEVRQLHHRNYELTGMAWRKNIERHKEEVLELLDKTLYKKYHRYLLSVELLAGASMLDYRPLIKHVVKSYRLPPTERETFNVHPSPEEPEAN